MLTSSTRTIRVCGKDDEPGAEADPAKELERLPAIDEGLDVEGQALIPGRFCRIWQGTASEGRDQDLVGVGDRASVTGHFAFPST